MVTCMYPMRYACAWTAIYVHVLCRLSTDFYFFGGLICILNSVANYGCEPTMLMCKRDCCISTGLRCTIHPTTVVQHGLCRLYSKLLPVLRQYFGCEEFRPGQVDAILSVLHGHDVFVRMATGSGKSMCMYLPPLVCGKPAVAIIICPLVGLMEEQVWCFGLVLHTVPILITG